MKTYTRAKEYNISEIIGDRPAKDFLLAIKFIDSSFSTPLLVKISNEPNILDVFKIVEDFRHIYRLSKDTYSRETNSAFSTQQQQQQERPTFKGSNIIEPSRCECEIFH